MTRDLTRDEVLERLTPENLVPPQVRAAFLRLVPHPRTLVNRALAKRLLHEIARDGALSDKEAVGLYPVLDYRGILPEGRRYLWRYLILLNEVRRRAKVPEAALAMPLSDADEQANVALLQKAALLPIRFSLPDQPGMIYSFRRLGTVARVLRHGGVEQYRFLAANVEGHGMYSRLGDFLALEYVARRPVHLRQSTVVHEAVHASQDMAFAGGDLGHTEVAAHLAQAVWIAHAGKPFPTEGRLAHAVFQDTAEELAGRDDWADIAWVKIDEGTYADLRTALADADGKYAGSPIARAPQVASGLDWMH